MYPAMAIARCTNTRPSTRPSMMLMIAHDRPRGAQMLREKLPNDELLLPEARANNVSASILPGARS